MAREARTFSRIVEADAMIQALCDKYPEVLWSVRPSTVAIMGVDNQERTEKAMKKNPVYAKLRPVKGAEKSIFQNNDIPIRFIVEMYWSDWHAWTSELKQMVIFNKMLEISPEDEKRNSPDCVGFRILMDKVGVTWDISNGIGLPNLLQDDIKFDISLRPGLDTEEDDGGDSDEE